MHSSLSLYVCNIVTPPRNRGGVIFLMQFGCVSCLSICLSVCVPDSACEQNSRQTDEPIWTRVSLNGCLPHWLRSYWNWWPWVKGQGHRDLIFIFFLHNTLLISQLYISAFLYLIKLKFDMYLNFIKIKWVMVS